jgi:RND family efflux transporter MFP subunit
MTGRVQMAIAVCWCAFAMAGCGHDSPEEVESETVVPVSAAAARRGSITAVTRVTGIITAAPGAELIVVAPEPARILELKKGEGDTVRRGDVLVRFEIPSIAAELSKQEAEVMRAQARFANARAAQTRAKDLYERGVAARKDVEDADREIADAEADLAGGRAAAAAAQTMAARSVVRASFDGIVAKRSHNPGDLVEATASDAVLRIVDPRRLEVVASIPVAESLAVKVGARARLLSEAETGPASVLTVIVRPAAVQEGSVTVPVRLAFDKPTNYPIGAPVQVGIETDRHGDVVLVPASAVVREGEETAVFIVVKDRAQRRPVKTGIEGDEDVEIASGVAAGEMVITNGQTGLPDGATIALSGK